MNWYSVPELSPPPSYAAQLIGGSILRKTCWGLVGNYQICQDFVDAGEAFSHEDHGVLLERFHAASARSSRISSSLAPVATAALQFVGHRQQFEYADAALLSGVVALVAAFAPIEGRSVVLRVSEIAQSDFVHFGRALCSSGKAAGQDVAQ